MSSNRVFVPPPDDLLYEAARRVCEARAERQADPSLADWEMTRGLAEFLRACAQVQADNLNHPTPKIDKPA